MERAPSVRSHTSSVCIGEWCARPRQLGTAGARLNSAKCPRLGPVMPFIDEILRADHSATAQQRHTRLYLRTYAARASGLCVPVAGAPLRARPQATSSDHETGSLRAASYPPAAEAQVDWYEANVDLGGGERTAGLHHALHGERRSFPSRPIIAPRSRLFWRLTSWPSSVSAACSVAALRQAEQRGAKILRGHQREETERFIAFRSHWRYAASFCNPGEATRRAA